MLSEKLRALASELRALADEAAELERDITRATLGDVPATIAASDAAEACHQCGSPMGSGYCLACQPPAQPHPQASGPDWEKIADDLRSVVSNPINLGVPHDTPTCDCCLCGVLRKYDSAKGVQS